MHSAQSPQAEPVRPSWNNMLMIAIMTRRLFLISEFNYFLRSSSSWKGGHDAYGPQAKEASAVVAR